MRDRFQNTHKVIWISAYSIVLSLLILHLTVGSKWELVSNEAMNVRMTNGTKGLVMHFPETRPHSEAHQSHLHISHDLEDRIRLQEGLEATRETNVLECFDRLRLLHSSSCCCWWTEVWIANEQKDCDMDWRNDELVLYALPIIQLFVLFFFSKTAGGSIDGKRRNGCWSMCEAYLDHSFFVSRAKKGITDAGIRALSLVSGLVRLLRYCS